MVSYPMAHVRVDTTPAGLVLRRGIALKRCSIGVCCAGGGGGGGGHFKNPHLWLIGAQVWFRYNTQFNFDTTHFK